MNNERKMDKGRPVGYIDPASIDLDLAYEMSRGYVFGEPPERMGIERRGFPKIIDFEDFAKVEAPPGYGITIPTDRTITIHVECFDPAICWNSTHNYCHITFHGLDLHKLDDPGRWLYHNPVTGKELKEPFGCIIRLDIEKPVTEEDLKYGDGDWDRFEVGWMCHRWPTSANAIECARRIIELRFQNFGDVEVDDNGRDQWQ